MERPGSPVTIRRGTKARDFHDGAELYSPGRWPPAHWRLPDGPERASRDSERIRDETPRVQLVREARLRKSHRMSFRGDGSSSRKCLPTVRLGCRPCLLLLHNTAFASRVPETHSSPCVATLRPPLRPRSCLPMRGDRNRRHNAVAPVFQKAAQEAGLD